MSTNAVSSDRFKQAMGQFPSGVTIVTTVADDEKYGFTASAFSSLSLSPPLVLVCLANNADCFESFNKGERFAVNIIDRKHEKLAFKFAEKGCDKFSAGEFVPGASGLPILSGSLVSLECRTHYTYPGGDHVILVGQVEYLTINEGTPAIWYAGGFHCLDT